MPDFFSFIGPIHDAMAGGEGFTFALVLIVVTLTQAHMLLL